MLLSITVWLCMVMLLICSTYTMEILLERSIVGNGFHREMTTVIEIPTALIASAGKCDIVLVEHLPSGAYVDPFQLKSLQTFGGPKFISPSVDIEKPEFSAAPFNLSLFTPTSVKKEKVMLTNITIPIHLRYHHPTSQPKEEYASIIMRNPTLLIKCSSDVDFKEEIPPISHPCNSDGIKLCDWYQVNYHSDVDAVELLVPIGNKQHIYFVVLGTAAVTFFGCQLILCKVINLTNKFKVS